MLFSYCVRDQWWIYKPPFNASFVRQQWELGYEVDTFHTYVCPNVPACSSKLTQASFHWGDVKDGKFKAHAGIIDEARAVTRESFKRQGLV